MKSSASRNASSALRFAAILRFLPLALPLALPALSASAQAPADSSARIQQILTQLGRIRRIHEAAISPDGKNLAWVVAGEHGGTDVVVAPRDNPEKTRRVTAGDGKPCGEEEIAWSPDSKALAYLSDCQAKEPRSSQEDLFLYDLDSSKSRRLTHLKGNPDMPAFAPDGRSIAFLFVENATRQASPLAAEKPPAGVIGEDGIEVQRVASVSVSGGDVSIVSPASLYVYEFNWSPDSKSLAYVAAAPPGENNWWVARLYTQPASSAEPRAILDPVTVAGPLHGLQIAVPRWSPDGSQIAFIGGLMSDQGATGGDIYLVPASGGEPRNLTLGRKASSAWLAWAHKDVLDVVEIVNGSPRIFAFDVAGQKEIPGQSDTLDGNLRASDLELSLSISDNHELAMVRSLSDHAPEVWTGRLDSLHPATHYNDQLQPLWGKVESVLWTSAVTPGGADTFQVQGWLHYPASYDPAKKYPLVVMVHGGPSSAVLPSWPGAGYGPAAFSALGYFVLEPNPRGSYGQGEAFTQANRRDFGYGDLRDILAGVDAVVQSRSIDPDRVGITGWSYGGFMTMFAVTQTNRFRAAVAGAGISDWQSYYGENSIDQWMTPFFGATVYDDPAVYARSSALSFIHQAKTPMLIVVGDRDGECPAPQSFEMWHALHAENVPTRLVVYPNEGHGFTQPEHRVDVISRAMAWFEQYMPARP